MADSTFDPVAIANKPIDSYGPNPNAVTGQQSAAISDALRLDHNLLQDPTLMMGLTKNYNLTGAQINSAVQTANFYKSLQAKAQNPDTNIFSEIWNGIKDVGKNAVGYLESQQQKRAGNEAKYGVLGGIVEQNKSAAEGLGRAATDTYNVVNDAVNRAIKTLSEVSGGTLNPLTGLAGDAATGSVGSDYKDALDTVANLATGATNLVNPFSNQNVLMIANHYWAFYQSMVHKYGAAYANGYMAPSALLAALTDGGSFEAEGVAAASEETVNPALLESAQQAVRESRPLTDEEKIALIKARRGKLADGMKGLKDMRTRAAKVGEGAGLPIKAMSTVLRNAGSMQERLTYMYAIAQQTAQKDPHLAELWNKTADGYVYGTNGKRLDKLGEDVMKMYFGQHPGDMFYQPTANFLNFYTTYMAGDPAGKALNDFNAGRKAGFTGVLGKWWGGLGIQSAEDIDRTAQQYPSVMRAYRFMAEHDAGAINDKFRNTYSAAVLHLLGDAKSVDEVMEIHRLIADGADMLTRQAPTLGLYSFFKQGLTGRLAELFGATGQMLSSDEAFAANIDRLAREEVTIGTAPDSDFYVANNDVTLRARSQFARWVATRLSRSPQYFDAITKKMENMVIRPRDPGAIAAIGDMARAALLPETTINAVMDFMLKAETDEQFTNAYRMLVYHMQMRRVMAGMPEATSDVLRTLVSSRVWEETVRATGVDGGGEAGSFGPDKPFDSVGEGVDRQNAGWRPGQRGTLRFIDPKVMNNLSRTIRQILVTMGKNGVNINNLMEDIKQIESLAMYNHADINKFVRMFANTSSLRMSTHGFTTSVERDTYNKVFRSIVTMSKNVAGRTDRTAAELFADFYQRIGREMKLVQSAIEQVRSIETADILKHMTPQQAVDEFGVTLRIHNFPEDEYGMAKLPDDIKIRLEAERAAYNDAVVTLNKLALNPAGFINIDAVLEFAKEAAKARGLLGDAAKKYAEELAGKLNAVRQERPNFEGNTQHIVDAMDGWQSKTFVPMALTSTRWAQHVGLSEALLNAVRMGPMSFFDARVMGSIAKHELNGLPMSKIERNAVRDVVAGFVLGLERAWIGGMDPFKANRMLDDVTGFVVRHGTKLPGGVEHGTELLSGRAAANVKHKYYDNVDGQAVERTFFRDSTYTTISPGEAGYSKAVEEMLTSLHLDEFTHPIMQALRDAVNAAGMEQMARNPEAFVKAAIKNTKDYFVRGPGKKALDDFSKGVENLISRQATNAEFKALTADEQARVVAFLRSQVPDAEKLSYESLKPYMQQEYARYQKQIDNLSIQRDTLEKQINSLAAQLKVYEQNAINSANIVDTATRDAYEKAQREVETLEKQIADAQKRLDEHPYKLGAGVITPAARKVARKELADMRSSIVETLRAAAETAQEDIMAAFTIHGYGYYDMNPFPLWTPHPDAVYLDAAGYPQRYGEDATPWGFAVGTGNSGLINLTDMSGRKFFIRGKIDETYDRLGRSADVKRGAWDQIHKEYAEALDPNDWAGNFVRAIENFADIKKLYQAANRNQWGGLANSLPSELRYLEDDLRTLDRGGRTETQQIRDYLVRKQSRQFGSDLLHHGDMGDLKYGGTGAVNGIEDLRYSFDPAVYASEDAHSLGIQPPVFSHWSESELTNPDIMGEYGNPVWWVNTFGNDTWRSESDFQLALQAYREGKSPIAPFLDRYDRQSLLDWIEQHDPQHTRISPEDVPGGPAAPVTPINRIPTDMELIKAQNAAGSPENFVTYNAVFRHSSGDIEPVSLTIDPGWDAKKFAKEYGNRRLDGARLVGTPEKINVVDVPGISTAAAAVVHDEPYLNYIQKSIDDFYSKGYKIEQYDGRKTSQEKINSLSKDFAPIERLSKKNESQLETRVDPETGKTSFIRQSDAEERKKIWLRAGVTNAAFEKFRDEGQHLLVARNAEGKIVGALTFVIDHGFPITIRKDGVETTNRISDAIFLDLIGSTEPGVGPALEHELAGLGKKLHEATLYTDVAHGSAPYHEKMGRTFSSAKNPFSEFRGEWTKEQFAKVGDLEPRVTQFEPSEPTPVAKPPVPSHGMPWVKSAEQVYEEEMLKNASSNYLDQQQQDYSQIQEEFNNLRDKRKRASENVRKIGKQVAALPNPNQIIADAQARYKQLTEHLDNLHQQAYGIDRKTLSALDKQREIKINATRIERDRIAKRASNPFKAKSKLITADSIRVGRKLAKRLDPLPTLTGPVYKDLMAKTVDKVGRKAFSRGADVDKLVGDLSVTAKQAIMDLPEDVRMNMVRSEKVTTSPNWRKSDDPIEDWSHVAAHNIVHLFTGEGAGGSRIHTDLLDMALSGNIPYGREFSEMMAKKGSEGPINVPAQGFRAAKGLELGSAPDLIKRVADTTHEKVLSPIVNYISRTPTMLLEFHNQMELLRPFVEKGMYSELEAQTLAESRAMIEMYKYVHNPLDKLNWEKNMRILAPFYFAKNQAWRRAFRMMGENPGAFERYLKICLGVSDYVSMTTSGGQTPTIGMPGSTILGAIGGVAGGGLPGFSGLAFGFAGSPGSVDSIVPTGSNTSAMGMLGDLIRPPWGEYVTVPLKLVRAIFQGHHPVVKKWVNAILGPVSANTSMIDDIAPSTTLRDVVSIIGNATGHPSSAELSVEHNVFLNSLRNLYKQYIDEARKEAAKDPGWNSATPAQQRAEITGLAEYKMNKLLNDPGRLQEYLDAAHSAALMMTIVRAGLNLGSPFALSIQQSFSQSKLFDSILNAKNPDGSLKYSFTQAAEKFTQDHPERIFDLVSHTNSPFESYPETTQALDFINNHLALVHEYPYAMAFLIPRTGKFSPQARQLEMTLALRSVDSPKQFADAIRIALGNDYYYNYLQPYVMQQPGMTENVNSVDENGNPAVVQQLNYQGQQELTRLATAFSNNVNPVWGEYHTGASRKDTANIALKQMDSFLNSDVSSFMDPAVRSQFRDLVKSYKDFAQEVRDLRAKNLKHDAWAKENAWYQWMAEAVNSTNYAPQAYFIDTVLRKFPDTY